MEKEKIIAAEKRKLNKIAKQIPDDKKPIAQSLITELSFMAGTLAELRDIINTAGVIDDFKNGAQEMKREAPALKSYNTTIQRYSALYKQLTDLLPKSDPKQTQSELLEFINNA